MLWFPYPKVDTINGNSKFCFVWVVYIWVPTNLKLHHLRDLFDPIPHWFTTAFVFGKTKMMSKHIAVLWIMKQEMICYQKRFHPFDGTYKITAQNRTKHSKRTYRTKTTQVRTKQCFCAFLCGKCVFVQSVRWRTNRTSRNSTPKISTPKYHKFRRTLTSVAAAIR